MTSPCLTDGANLKKVYLILYFIKPICDVIKRSYDIKNAFKCPTDGSILKKMYVIYYVIKLLSDVIIHPYDVKKCIKLSHRWFKSKKGVSDI